MSLKSFVVIGVGGGLIILGIFLVIGRIATTEAVSVNTEIVASSSPDEIPVEARYIATDGSAVTILFDSHAKVAILTGVGYEALMLPQGDDDADLYHNTDLGLVLKQEANQIVLTEYDTEIYRGQRADS